MTVVGNGVFKPFQRIDRPTMSRVVDMLEGSVNSQIPPKPILSSTTRSVPESPTI